jgi:hypothetical protein
MPAGELGVRALVIRGPWGRPEQIRHATLGLKWQVVEVVEHWQRPDDSPAWEGQPVLLAREVVLVDGPRPGRPGESGRFMLEVCSYGHVDGWRGYAARLTRGGHRPGRWVTVGSSLGHVGEARMDDPSAVVVERGVLTVIGRRDRPA